MPISFRRIVTAFWQTGARPLAARILDYPKTQRELRTLLAKPGDQLIKDIGLTRDKVRRLANDWRP